MVHSIAAARALKSSLLATAGGRGALGRASADCLVWRGVRDLVALGAVRAERSVVGAEAEVRPAPCRPVVRAGAQVVVLAAAVGAARAKVAGGAQSVLGWGARAELEDEALVRRRGRVICSLRAPFWGK